MNVTHDFESLHEKIAILKWFDVEINLEYEVTDGDTLGTGSIDFFGLTPFEYVELMDFLVKNEYVETSKIWDGLRKGAKWA